jgi:voltage-gated potassium channel Kch
MSLHAQNFAAAAVPQMLAMFGVSTTITPKGASAITRTVRFQRSAQLRTPGTPDGFSASVEAWIADDADLGVTSITFGADKIVVPTQFGGQGLAYAIMDYIERDNGFWHVRVYVNK